MKCPADLGLPWDDWRLGQRPAIRAVLKSKAKTVVVQAPTGSGKSAIALGLMRLDERRSGLLTATLGLQQQYLAQAGDWLNDVRGMANYQCLAAVDEFKGDYPSLAYAKRITCDKGLCRINRQCTLKERGCSYFDAYRNAVGRNAFMTSYAYYFASSLHGRGLGASARLIGDEGHAVAEQLALACQLRVPVNEVRGRVPKTMGQWRQWAEQELSGLRKKVDAQGELEEKLHVKSREDRLTALRRLDDAWAVEVGESAFTFEPIDVTALAGVLHKGAGQVVLLSATITEASVAALGLSDVEFISVPSRFAVTRRPVYLLDGGRIDYRATEETFAWWHARIDQIIERRSDRKGIIHTVSYDRQRALVERSAHRRRFIIPSSSAVLPAAIAKFKAMPQSSGAILIAPNVATGFDFPYTECEYQIIVKVPFPNTRSAIAKARCAAVSEYRERITMQTLVQAIGRGMRAEDDQCECVAPETKVLTADLCWRRADQIAVGERLLSFDEEGAGRGHSRQWRVGEVIRAKTWQMPRVAVVLETGKRIVTTPNHPWLTLKASKQTHSWVRSDDLKPGTRLARIVTPWQDFTIGESFDAGWLSGIIDGEGCLVLREGRKHPAVTGIWVSQNDGVVLDSICERLEQFNFQFSIQKRPGKGKAVKVLGGWDAHMRLLGRFRPHRLLEKFLAHQRTERVRSFTHVRVERVDWLEPGPITSLQTSTKTFVAEGFGMHNTFIVDEHARWFFGKNSKALKYAPSYVLDAVVVTNRLPAPPPRLTDRRGE